MKQKHLFFIRHGKLLLPYKNHSEMPFRVLADLALGKLNPPIDEQFALSSLNRLSKSISLKNLEKIYSSPSSRCQTTAEIIKKFVVERYKKEIQMITLPELTEIRFDLNKFYHHQSKNDLNMEDINNRVLLEMVKGKKCESADDAYKRTALVFNKINKSETSLLITHDFFMRVIEVYIKNQGRNNFPITYNILKNTNKNLYLQGFKTNILLSKFSVL